MNSFRRRAAQQFVLIRLVADAVEVGAADHRPGVQERDALALGDGAEARA